LRNGKLVLLVTGAEMHAACLTRAARARGRIGAAGLPARDEEELSLGMGAINGVPIGSSAYSLADRLDLRVSAGISGRTSRTNVWKSPAGDGFQVRVDRSVETKV
jgi:hypothetical protein